MLLCVDKTLGLPNVPTASLKTSLLLFSLGVSESGVGVPIKGPFTEGDLRRGGERAKTSVTLCYPTLLGNGKNTGSPKV